MLKLLALTSLFSLNLAASTMDFKGEACFAASDAAGSMMPVPQNRLQKTYITADRIFLNDHGIFFLDYNNTIQSTFGVFTDQGGLYVFTYDPFLAVPMAR